jgi:hypothetical protein
VAATGLEDLLDVAVTSASEDRSPLDSPGASGSHPTHGRGELAVGSKADPGRAGKAWLQGIGENRGQVYAFTFQPGTLSRLGKVFGAICIEHMGLRFCLRSDDFVRDFLRLLRDPARQQGSPPRATRWPSGQRSKLSNAALGISGHRDFSFAIATAAMARPSAAPRNKANPRTVQVTSSQRGRGALGEISSVRMS